MNNKTPDPPSTNGKSPNLKAACAVGFMLLGICAIGAIAFWWNSENLGEFTVQLWMAGAGALGLVSGFITGLSKKEGSGTSFMTFVGTGLLVPILGGVAALLGQTEKVTERSIYENTELIERTTETVTSLSDDFLHPLALLGSFFLVFGVLAIFGIVGGMLLKKGGLSVALFDK